MTNKMAKLSAIDKIRIQTLREQSYGAKAICKAYPRESWNLRTVNNICKRVDEKVQLLNGKLVVVDQKSARTDAKY